MPEPTGEIAQARVVTAQSARQAAADLTSQEQKLDWERSVLAPAIRKLHQKNHVADAIIQLIESSRKT
jgi:hypothetical protein